uniref:Uncharacterized protein n=1 Tax=Setaria digitata TaxID=48799 RepID=A0A915PIV5_9BILA
MLWNAKISGAKVLHRMRLVFTSWEPGRDDSYGKSWKILSNSSILTANDIVIYQDDVLFLEDGCVYKYTSCGIKKPYLIETSFASFRFISFHAAYEKLFLVSEEGRLFGCGHTVYGECGVISSSRIESLREIELVTPLATCPHGLLITTAESLKVRLVRTSLSEVCVVDFDGRLWKYGDGRLEFDSQGRIQVRPLQLTSRSKVSQLCAGRKHFVCLTVPLTDGKIDTGVENSPTLRIRRSNKCEKCREEYELRLSTLMCIADQENESQISFPSCEEKGTVPTKTGFDINNSCLPLNTSKSARNQIFPPSGLSCTTKIAIVKPQKHTLLDEFEMKQLKSADAWDRLGKNSALVSMENLPGTCYKRDTNTADLSQNCAVHNDNTSRTNGKFSFADSENGPDLLPEIWTWGANENGQLGHGDLAMRREPFKVADLSSMYCIKVAAGDDHTIALTGTGELYVWGSNSDGQLKQSGSSHTMKPLLFKIGSHSFVLDAFANGSLTGVIVGGIANSATLYLCGNSTRENLPFSLSLPKEIGQPGWILGVNKNLVVGVHESNNEINEHFARLFILFRYAKFMERICQLCQKMHERSHVKNCPTSSKLLNKLTLSSTAYSIQIFRLVKTVRDILCNTYNLPFRQTFKTLITKYFFDVLFQFHADFVECLAYGCFTEFDIGYDFPSLHKKKHE